jgi:protocatechuate 3,4-dioxygenase beta subunit
MTCFGRPALLILLVLPLLALACSDNGTKPPPDEDDMLFGYIWTAADGTPVSGVDVVVADGDDYTIVAGPAVTNGDGRYSFGSLPPGRFYVLAFHSEFVVFDRTASSVTVEEGASKRIDMRMIPPDLWSPGPYRIEGVVLDDATGEPLHGAFVSSFLGAISHSFQGISLPWEAVTGEDGTFTLDAGIATDEEGNPVGLVPVGVSKEGYIPFMSALIEIPDPPDSTAEVALHLTAGESTGGIRGMVLYDSGPARDIEVGLDFYNWPGPAPGEKAVPVLGKTAMTDTLGIYEFGGLAPGLYTVEPAFLPDDGYLADITSLLQVEVAEGKTAVLPDIHLAKALEPFLPEPGATIDDATPTFRWEAFADSVEYRLWYSTGYVEERVFTVPEAEFTLPDTLAFSPGAHVRWGVRVYDAGRLAAGFEEAATFLMAGP